MTVDVGCNGGQDDYYDQHDCNRSTIFLVEKQPARPVDVRCWYCDGESGVRNAMNIRWVYFRSYFNIVGIKVDIRFGSLEEVESQNKEMC